MRNYLLVAFCFLLLSACAGVPLENQAVTVADDQFSSAATITGTKLFDNPFGGVFKEWFIRSFVDKKTGVVVHQLYIQTSYIGQWHFFESAADDTATSLPVTRISQDVGDCAGGCSLSETLGVELSEATLKARATSGFKVKISARDGSAFILDIPPGQIQPQLAAVDSYRSAHQILGATAQPIAPVLGVNQPTTPVLGVKLMPTPTMFEAMWQIKGGAMVVNVTPGSPADRAGIKPGDFIMRYEDKKVITVGDLQSAIAGTTAGATISLSVHRANKELNIPVTF